MTVKAVLSDAYNRSSFPNGGQVGTVRLYFELLPSPEKDVRAWEKLGLALYDAKRYEEALIAFEKMATSENVSRPNPDGALWDRAHALLWQGHMLDLLDRRSEAVAKYREVAAMEGSGRLYDRRYGLDSAITPYAKERIETPFVRIESQDTY